MLATRLLLLPPLLGLSLLLGATPLRAQGTPPPEEAAEDAKGPNLQIPAELEPALKSELKAAIAKWERAETLLRGKGAKAARSAVDAAIDALEATRKQAGKCALPSYYLGIAYQLLGLYYGEEKALDRAVVRLKAAVRFNARFHEAYVELGDAHGHVDKLKDAAKAYDQAVELAPDYALAYERRAICRFRQDLFPEAREDIRAARKLKPGDPSLLLLEQKLDLVLDGPKWQQGYSKETKNYVIHTNVSQAFADEIAERAELIRRLYLQIFPDPPKTKRKYPIVVFASKQEYHQNGGPPSAGGHYDPNFKQLFLFKYPNPRDTYIVLHHEGFHQFLDGILKTKAPQWFDEGLGDFFGPSEHVKQGGDEGMRFKPNPWRLNTVQRMIHAGRITPFETLMRMSQEEMYGADAGLHYAQAWSMIYFFVMADDRAYFKYMKTYFNALRKGKDRFKAYDKAFGSTDMVALQKRWREYMLTVRE